jgi:hypothetical protein
MLSTNQQKMDAAMNTSVTTSVTAPPVDHPLLMQKTGTT